MPATLWKIHTRICLAFVALFFVSARQAHAQQEQAPSGFDKAVIEKSFRFIAQSATPLRGAMRTLTPGYYYLEVHKDSLISLLPYYGNRYSTPTPTELIYGGYQFENQMITYTAVRHKKYQEIRITTKPYNDRLTISISISKGGWAEVYIQSSGQDPVSYYGRLAPL